MNKFKSYSQFNEANMSDMFRSAHAAIDEDKLIPLQNLIGHPKLPSQEEFDEAIEFLDIDPDHVFYNPQGFISPIMYWKDAVYYPFHGSLNMEALKMFHAKEAIQKLTEFMENCVQKKDYESLFSRADKKILIPLFVKLYKQIPDNQKYDIFTDLYVRSEYGFVMFPKTIIIDCFNKRKMSADRKKRIDEFFKKYAKLNDDGYIPIYRGQNTESAKEEDAFSWTMSKKTAKFFADRFNKGQGKVITKQIHPEEIIDYFDFRGESEVIIIPPKYK